jgi:hypothetical protein
LFFSFHFFAPHFAADLSISLSQITDGSKTKNNKQNLVAAFHAPRPIYGRMKPVKIGNTRRMKSEN